ncbi:MAG: lipocalin-like domain-containing protein [Prevotella sp.]|nr:lipocalin-like domain-containing protein [Prevotella sp.]
MKQLKSHIKTLMAIATCMVVTSCGWVEFETSGNGHLDGYWHMTSVDSLDSGVTRDMHEERVFWSVQGSLLIVYSPDFTNTPQRIVCQFTRENKQLTIIEPHIFDRAGGDPLVEDIEQLRPFGINKLDERFKITTLTSNHLTIETEALRLNFRKM